MHKTPGMDHNSKILGKLPLIMRDKGSFRQIKIMGVLKVAAYQADSLKEALSNSNCNLQLKLERSLIMINLLTHLP